VSDVVRLRGDEIELLSESGRCEGCGHLEVLHTEHHDMPYCEVGDCPCEYGRLPMHGPKVPDGDLRVTVRKTPDDKFISHRTPIECLRLGSRLGSFRREGWPAPLIVEAAPVEASPWGCKCPDWFVIEGHPHVIAETIDEWHLQLVPPIMQEPQP
jgi:hypothetical protein